MAFQSNRNLNTQPAAQNESWKAKAFINLYIPTKEGRRKIGSIALKESRAFEKAVLTRLEEGGPEALAGFLSVLEADFQLADKQVPTEDLGF